MARALMRSIPLLPVPELYDLVKSINRTQDNLNKEVKDAVDYLQRSSGLIEILEKQLVEREKKLITLKEEYEKISQLSSLTSEQARAVTQKLEESLGKSRNLERAISLIINIVAGVVVLAIGVIFADEISSGLNFIRAMIFG
ncbi:MAG: hypothetical protein R3D29_02530 [Nitratireductor sp.]